MSSRAEAASHGNYMPLVTALSPSALTVAVEKKKRRRRKTKQLVRYLGNDSPIGSHGHSTLPSPRTHTNTGPRALTQTHPPHR